MVRLKEGDRVDCRIKNGKIVGPHDGHDEIKTFEIVSTDNFGYYLFVPHYIHLYGTNLIDAFRCRKLSIDARFIDEQTIYITENMVISVSKQDGISCSRCKDFFRMAAPNQPDGKTMICWGCRDNPYR
jgi:hypothetical protein